MGDIVLGTSGWSYEEWVEPFYRFKNVSKLRFYNRVFRTAEIDSTFYRYPTEGTVFGWLRYTDPGFVYTAKLPKQITHEKMLNLNEGVEEDINKFCELMRRLLDGGKLGCLLIQLPPSFTYDYVDRLESFFKVLPREFSYAVEFRDLSWMNDETWKLLSKHAVAYANVDEPLLPPDVKVTSNIAYFRWHGRGRRPWFDYRYKEEELKPWVPKVKEAAGRVEKVYGYFNNHYHGYAVENCLQVLEMLGVLTPEQTEAKARIQKYFLMPRRKEKVEVATLDQWTGQSPEELLQEFTDAERLKRAKKIKDEEITVEELSDSVIKASVRDYHIVIDLGNKIILHDCADWDKLIPQKFCKHLAKLMLTIGEDKASRVLKRISAEIKSWEFKPYTGRLDTESE
nr:DUF72 domain-containing protein [Candidatus Njordarchaeota archaeon]